MRTWNYLIEKPKFWKWATLRLDSANYQEIILSLQTGQTRVNNLQQIRVYLEEEEENNWVLSILEDLVTAVMDDGSHLKSLDIAGSGVSSVKWASLSPVLLAQFLVSLKEGSFDLFTPNDAQTYMLTFNPTEWIISHHLTPDHVTSLFTKIADSSVMNVKSLSLIPNAGEIPHISPELVSRAVTKLEKFDVHICTLTDAQISAVLTKLSVEKDLILKILDLSNNYLRSVPTQTLVAGISSLEEVDFSESHLTSEQLTEIFSRLSLQKDHKLRNLYLDSNDLSSVPTENLVAGISSLEVVDLSRTRLTTQQLKAIYRMVADRRCFWLREINLQKNNLSSVPKYLRDRAKQNQSVQIILRD